MNQPLSLALRTETASAYADLGAARAPEHAASGRPA